MLDDQISGEAIADIAERPMEADNACLREIEAEIDDLTRLEDNWNDEGAPAIDQRSIQRARDFASRLVREIAQGSSACRLPSVYPSVDGGVQFLWNLEGGQTLLTFHPGQRELELQQKETGKPSVRRSISLDDALHISALSLRAA